MRVLVRRNRPSTKQWTSANFDWIKRYGDEVVPGILRICTQRGGKLVRKVKRQSGFNRQSPNHRVRRPLLRSLQIASISVPERPVTRNTFYIGCRKNSSTFEYEQIFHEKNISNLHLLNKRYRIIFHLRESLF